MESEVSASRQALASGDGVDLVSERRNGPRPGPRPLPSDSMASSPVPGSLGLDDGHGLEAEAVPDVEPGFPAEQGGDRLDQDLVALKQEARAAAHRDARDELPPPESTETPASERMLRHRCREVFEAWLSRRRKAWKRRIARMEDEIAELLSETDLELDRFERKTNELVRFHVQRRNRRRQKEEESNETRRAGPSGLSTRIYVAALSFLGLVEFFANAPVFSALLPRDPLTEEEIQIVAETSSGWLAGGERVLAQIVLRPDAALLAAGVVAFLCILAHFFGHSLRELIARRAQDWDRVTTAFRVNLENVVPMVLAGVGLCLVVGVLYEGRLILGQVGEERYREDMEAVQELRRQSGWLRADGELLKANETQNRADDLEAAATNLQQYAQSMSRMSFPIFLLNVALVLSAVSAAYFHRREGWTESFRDGPFEEERSRLIAAAEESASRISGHLAQLIGANRRLRSEVEEGPWFGWRSVVRRLEGTILLYRGQNARARSMETGAVRAFAAPVELDLEPGDGGAGARTDRDPNDYEAEMSKLEARFDTVRARLRQQAVEHGGDDAHDLAG